MVTVGEFFRIFLGDFNTADWRGAMGELEYRTGWKW